MGSKPYPIDLATEVAAFTSRLAGALDAAAFLGIWAVLVILAR